ncbi:hypothetical protein NVP1208B_28 [Vibrio phage 1.208.B._10N.222.52.A7]|nr:hypothetical protein NVP1208B_28 [Vibrio phage 1.208.B._10N.222.52.A7]
MIERCCGKDCMELSTTELVRKGMDEDLIAINTAAGIVEEALNVKRD